jgi:uncharacterized protein YndB with AHSA1/START domain
MTTDFIATASITIESSADRVWTALTDPALVKEWMFGTDLESSFEVGGPITWSGEWEGKPYEDTGTIMQVDPGERLQFTHFSPLTGADDVPENYHTVEYTLHDNGHRTLVTITQDNNPDAEAQAHSADNWSQSLQSLKKSVEARQ